MLKKLVAAGAVAAAMGGVVLASAPASAHSWNPGSSNRAGNFQILPIQACRGIDVAGIGAAVHNILGIDNENGPCVNGPVTGQS